MKGEDFYNIVPKQRLLLSQARLPDGTWTAKEPDRSFGFFSVMDGHHGAECGYDAELFLRDDIMNCAPPLVTSTNVVVPVCTRTGHL
jgi:hypothetical protein